MAGHISVTRANNYSTMNLKSISLLFFALLAFGSTFAQDRYFTDKNHVAIEGYDPVAYLADGRAEKGNPAISFTHEQVVYQFASEAHRDLFKANPNKYLPQFGGWCAYAVGAYSGKAPVDPKTFKVIDGKVYLFYNKLGTNTLDLWNKDEVKLLPASHQNWPGIKDKPAKS